MSLPVSLVLLLEIYNTAGQKNLVPVVILCTGRILLDIEA